MNAFCTGIDAALKATPELVGRMVKRADASGLLELHPRATGSIPLLVQERLDVRFADLESANFALDGIPSGLVVPIPFVKPDDDALVVFHVTRITGGVIVGYSANHNVMDGAAMFHFMAAAAAFARGEGSFPIRASALPVHADGTRGVQSIEVPPFTTPVPKGDVVIHPRAGMRGFDKLLAVFADPNYSAAQASPMPAIRSGRLLFTQKAIAALKADLLGAMTPAQRAEIGFLSTNDAIVGLVWSAVTRARIACGCIAGDKTAQFLYPVDARQRVVPKLELDPLGNASVLNWLAIQASAVGVGGLSGAALGAYHSRRSLLREFTDAKIRSLMAFYEAQPNKDCIDITWDWPFGRDSSMTSWSAFNVYNADFGSAAGGPPRCVLPGPPDGLIDGNHYALPPNPGTVRTHCHSDGSGCVEVTMCHRIPVFEALLKDEELARYAVCLDRPAQQ